jgi:hypothetical protein
MPNAYFQRLPLEESIKTLASGKKRCLICVTYQPEFIAEDPMYVNWDVLYTTTDFKEFSRQLRTAFALAKRYAGENCKNTDIPKLENVTEAKSDSFTIFIRYQ